MRLVVVVAMVVILVMVVTVTRVWPQPRLHRSLGAGDNAEGVVAAR